MILFNYESKLVMLNKKKRRKTHYRWPFEISDSDFKEKNSKRCQNETNKNKIQDHDSSRVLVRKYVDEVRTDKKHLQGTKMAQETMKLVIEPLGKHGFIKGFPISKCS